MEAFPTDAEANLVGAIRGRTDPQVSLVAEGPAGEVIGCILFTPVAIRSPAGDRQALGLGPMAVASDSRRQGVGAALIAAGLEACRAARARLVVVLGHTDYYPRFGFRPAWDSGLYYGRPGPNPAFMVREIERGALRGRGGEVVYDPAFDAV